MITREQLKDPNWLVASLLRLYWLQTSDEQAAQTTRHQNQAGFSATDAKFCSSLARQYLETRSLTENQIAALWKVIPKYLSQLNALGPMEPCEVEKRMPKLETPNRSVRINVDKQQLVIRFSYDPDLVGKVKTLTGRRWNSESKTWTAPATTTSVASLREWGFELSPGVQQWIKDQEPKPVSAIKAAHFHRLFPYQQEGVLQMERWRGRMILGDDPGLGKTAQTLVWLDAHPELRPAVVVCPASIKFVWEREAANWMEIAPKIEVLKGKNGKALPKADLYVVNYDILSGWVEELKRVNPRVIVGDEIHFVKSRSAARSKAFRKLCEKVPHVLGLTGTLILNRPVEGFIPLNIVAQHTFPSFTKYAFRWCAARHNGFGWDFSGASHTEELYKLMSETCYLRRNKADVLKDLPDKLYSVVPMDMDLDSRKDYDAAAKDLSSWLRENGSKSKAESATRAEALVRIETLKQLAIHGILKQTIEWVEDFLEQGQKLVLFAHHKVVVEALMTHFKDAAVKVDGSTTDRQTAVDRFQTDASVRLFVGSEAAKEGLTLTAASNVAFIEYPWGPGKLKQMEDRCHRIGQKDTVNVWYLVAKDTIIQNICQLIDKKRKILDRVLEGKSGEDSSIFEELLEGLK